MYILRLFQHNIATPPIDARLLREGSISIGRDPSTEWVMHDPQCRISRRHCDLSVEHGEITLLCEGANGVFDDETGHRFPDNIATTLTVPATLRFGDFWLIVDNAVQSDTHDGLEGQTFIMSHPLGASAKVPTDYSDNIEPTPNKLEGSLFDVFCEGAGLEPCIFSLEEPEDVMRRAGAVYRQMVLGIGDLMAERESMRRQYDITRTTINGTNNNPFKWGPTQRLARDLLMAESNGFSSGPAALKASFADIKMHLIATFSGLHEALRAAVGTFDPISMDNDTSLGKSLFQSRAARICAEVEKRHEALVQQLDHGADGALNQSFVKAYNAASAEMDAEQP